VAAGSFALVSLAVKRHDVVNERALRLLRLDAFTLVTENDVWLGAQLNKPTLRGLAPKISERLAPL
jgi:hypothetical protein